MSQATAEALIAVLDLEVKVGAALQRLDQRLAKVTDSVGAYADAVGEYARKLTSSFEQIGRAGDSQPTIDQLTASNERLNKFLDDQDNHYTNLFARWMQGLFDLSDGLTSWIKNALLFAIDFSPFFPYLAKKIGSLVGKIRVLVKRGLASLAKIKMPKFKGVTSAFGNIFKGARGAIGRSAAKYIPSLGKSLFGGMFRSLLGWIIRLGPMLLKGLVAAFAFLSNPIGWGVLIGLLAAGVAYLIYAFWDELVAGWDWLAKNVGELAGKLWDELVAGWDWLAKNATELPGKLWSAIKEWFLSHSWGQWAVDKVNQFWESLKASWDWLVTKATELPGKLWSSIKELFDLQSWGQIATDKVNQFWESLKATWDWLVENFKDLPSNLLAKITETDWVQLGKDKINDFWEGLKSIGSAITDWFWSLLPDWVKDLFGSDEKAADSGAKAEKSKGLLGRVADTTTKLASRARGLVGWLGGSDNAEAVANYQGNIAAAGLSGMVPVSTTDQRDQSMHTELNVEMHVREPTQAPEQLATLVGNTIMTGAKSTALRVRDFK